MSRTSLVAIALLVCASTASARLNRAVLVPAYAPCASSSCQPRLASPYTFESVYLYSSPQAYSGPGKLALMVVVKGLKDASGNPVSGRLLLKLPPSRITLLGQGVTLADSDVLQPPYPVDVKNGSGRARFETPDSTRNLIVNSLGSPVLLDPEGNELATTGTQAKP